MKVLIAEDEVVSLRLLESSLRRWGYEPVIAHDGSEALRIMQLPDAPKLVIFDWLMPGVDGIELCRRIRAQTNTPYTYILLLTTKHAKEDVVRGLNAGADDYVIKPFDPRELKVRLRAGKRVLYLQDQLIAVNNALRELAMRDPLTELWNRGAALEILGNELSRSRRSGGSLGIAMVDLDNFKVVNDKYGHLVGDAVLCSVAKTMRASTRPYDCLARYGGEEFVLILPGCDETNAVSHGERLRAAVARSPIDTPGGPVQVTISVGVTVFNPDCGADAYGVLQAADDAMYHAKNGGRNRVEFGEIGTLSSRSSETTPV